MAVSGGKKNRLMHERKRWWDEINNYGRTRAEILGIKEQDVDRLIREYRQEKRTTRQQASK